MPKKGKQVIKSHVADKNLAHKCTQLIEQAKRIASPREKYGEFREVQLYNSMVTGMHNYYQLATLVAADFRKVNRAVMTVLTNRLRGQKESRLAKHGRELTKDTVNRDVCDLIATPMNRSILLAMCNTKYRYAKSEAFVAIQQKGAN